MTKVCQFLFEWHFIVFGMIHELFVSKLELQTSIWDKKTLKIISFLISTSTGIPQFPRFQFPRFSVYNSIISSSPLVLLKYGIHKKYFRKNEPLTSWTLFPPFFPDQHWSGKKTGGKKCSNGQMLIFLEVLLMKSIF